MKLSKRVWQVHVYCWQQSAPCRMNTVSQVWRLSIECAPASRRRLRNQIPSDQNFCRSSLFERKVKCQMYIYNIRVKVSPIWSFFKYWGVAVKMGNFVTRMLKCPLGENEKVVNSVWLSAEVTNGTRVNHLARYLHDSKKKHRWCTSNVIGGSVPLKNPGGLSSHINRVNNYTCVFCAFTRQEIIVRLYSDKTWDT